MRVFISYQREDTRADANALYLSLREEFGADSIYKDVHNIPLGQSWEPVIQAAVADSAILVLLVGPAWTGSRAIELELATALDGGKPIIPLFVRGGSAMRLRDHLTDGLSVVSTYNGVELDHDSWERDLAPVVTTIRANLAQAPSGSSRQGQRSIATAGTRSRSPRAFETEQSRVLISLILALLVLVGVTLVGGNAIAASDPFHYGDGSTGAFASSWFAALFPLVIAALMSSRIAPSRHEQLGLAAGAFALTLVVALTRLAGTWLSDVDHPGAMPWVLLTVAGSVAGLVLAGRAVRLAEVRWSRARFAVPAAVASGIAVFAIQTNELTWATVAELFSRDARPAWWVIAGLGPVAALGWSFIALPFRLATHAAITFSAGLAVLFAGQSLFVAETQGPFTGLWGDGSTSDHVLWIGPLLVAAIHGLTIVVLLRTRRDPRSDYLFAD